MGKRHIYEAGQRFNRLTLLSPCEADRNGGYWHCRCQCGREVSKFVYDVRRGKIQSCGVCIYEEMCHQHKAGERYGMLTLVCPVNAGDASALWVCRCDCGNTKKVNMASVRAGNTRSCGCLRCNRTGRRLSDDQVRAIRRDPRANRLIAASHEVSESTVRAIKTQKIYRHV